MPENQSDGGDITVLLLDSDDSVRENLQTQDNWERPVVTAVASPDTALNMLDETAYDALVVDPAVLPDQGIDLMRAVREHHPEMTTALYTELDLGSLPDVVRQASTMIVAKGNADSESLLWNKLRGTTVNVTGGVTELIESYERLVDVARDGICLINANGQLVYLNQSLADLLGYPREELHGEHISAILAPGELKAGQGIVQEIIQSDETESEVFDLKCQTKSGDDIIAAIHFTDIHDDAGNYNGIVCVFRDVTAQRRRAFELKRQRERLDAFGNHVAHDLRNPLAVVRSSLEMSRETGQLERVDEAIEATVRMEEIIENLLTLAQSGNKAVDTRPIGLDRAAKTAFERIDAQTAELGVESAGQLEADGGQLSQLLENLLRNAVEHGGQNVTITVGPLDNGFYVEDDGKGIPAEIQDRIFERGVTTDGSGIGLSIVQSIAEAHGWKVTATESEAGGARFEVEATELSMAKLRQQ